MISDTITQKITEAMKEKDEVRLSTLRMLSSALNYEKIAKMRKLTEEEELVVVKREAKKRTDAIEAYQLAGAAERAEKEKKELAILKEYLPEQLSEAEIEKIVAEAISEVGAVTPADLGKVIGVVMAKTKGSADGKVVAEVARSKLKKE